MRNFIVSFCLVGFYGCDLKFWEEEDDPMVDIEIISVFQTISSGPLHEIRCPEGWKFGGKFNIPKFYELQSSSLTSCGVTQRDQLHGIMCQREIGSSEGVGKEVFGEVQLRISTNNHVDACPKPWEEIQFLGCRKACTLEVVGLVL